jgi:transcriptional antiterminator RfaH
MPVLANEPDLWPESLCEERWGCANGEATWGVLHVRPRSEKALARQLLRREVGYYLPQRAQTKIFQRRKVTSWLPLFPGYLFFHGDEEALAVVSRMREVVSRIAIRDQTLFRDDLERVYRLIHAGLPVTPEERLEPGTTVRVCRGALVGLTGTLLQNRAGCRLVIGMDFLQRGASVEITADMVEAA